MSQNLCLSGDYWLILDSTSYAKFGYFSKHSEEYELNSPGVVCFPSKYKL